MKKNKSKSPKNQAGFRLVVATETHALIREALRQELQRTTLQMVHRLFQDEVAALCGPRYARQRDAEAVRGGSEKGSILWEGKRMPVCRPRAKDEDGEVHWINPADVEVERDHKGRPTGAKLVSDGRPVEIGAVEKMSKSKNNGIDPEGLVERYGADTVRLFSMFASPPDQSLEWSESGVEGASRFLRRVWSQVTEHIENGPVEALDTASLNAAEKEIRRLLHDTIAKVSDDVSRRYTFNTAIAAVMELTNHLARFEIKGGQSRAVLQEAWLAIVRLLGPITPHICEVLWEALGGSGPLYRAPWPQADESARQRTKITLVVQINGKLRARMELEPGVDQEAVFEQAVAIENVKRHMAGKRVRKVIHIPDRLLNIVVG